MGYGDSERNYNLNVKEITRKMEAKIAVVGFSDLSVACHGLSNHQFGIKQFDNRWFLVD